MTECGAVPVSVRALLDGLRLEEKVGDTFLLGTTDGDGWPHLALLSVGEVVILDETVLGLALHQGSGSTAAMRASGRALLFVIADSVPHRLLLKVESRPQPATGVGLAFFAAHIVSCRRDVVAYAELTSGIRFALRDEAAVLSRWQGQVEAIRIATLPGTVGSG